MAFQAKYFLKKLGPLALMALSSSRPMQLERRPVSFRYE
jgi:hypothetical protein